MTTDGASSPEFVSNTTSLASADLARRPAFATGNDMATSADGIHGYGANELAASGPVIHVRFDIFPDGGVSRLRVFGLLARTGTS